MRRIRPRDLMGHDVWPEERDAFIAWLREDEPASRSVHDMVLNDDGTVTITKFVVNPYTGKPWVNGDHVMSTTRTYRPKRPCPVELGEVIDP